MRSCMELLSTFRPGVSTRCFHQAGRRRAGIKWLWFRLPLLFAFARSPLPLCVIIFFVASRTSKAKAGEASKLERAGRQGESTKGLLAAAFIPPLEKSRTRTRAHAQKRERDALGRRGVTMTRMLHDATGIVAATQQFAQALGKGMTADMAWFYGLSGGYGLIALVATVQLVRIQLRVPEYGWTTQKVRYVLRLKMRGTSEKTRCQLT